MSTQAKLDVKRKPPALNYLEWIRQAAESGKGLGSMLWEIGRLNFGRTKLQPDEYFLYKLYDDVRFTPEAKRTFYGKSGRTIVSPWAQVATDKPTITALLQGFGLPTPETQAVVHPTRAFAGATALRDRDDVKRFLREEAQYPIFGKPFDSVCSLGTVNAKGYDAESDSLVLNDDQTIGLDDLLGQIEELGWKYLFQTLLRPHPETVPLIGDRVSTVRMFVLHDDEGCQLLRASWKIPVGNGADNFWRPGNCLAGIDVETGRIIRALRRTVQGTDEIECHPTTGAKLKGIDFPDWNEMRDVVMRAAVNLPDCHFQGWDVALTDRGPVLVELEGDGGDPIMEQLCFDTGLWQGRFKRFIEEVGPKMKKEKAEKLKNRQRSKWKRNINQLFQPAPPRGETTVKTESANEATTEVDPHELVAELQPTAPTTESKVEETVTAG